MESNPYIIQYPELMKDRKIIYLHGFMSSGQSGTVRLLREFMPGAEIIAPDIPLHPAEAVDMLTSLCEKEKPDLVIGTSMGGMYGEMVHGTDRILVNPAFSMADHLPSLTGRQEFQNPRQDGVQEFMVTKGLIKEYRDVIAGQCFKSIDAADRSRAWGLFGDEDDIVNTWDAFTAYYPQALHFHGGHRLIDKVVYHYLMPVVRWIDDRQQGRERPIVYISFDTLHDSYGKPAASVHKAFEYLIESYRVYIVAAAPTNDAATMQRVTEWTEQYLSVPAWGHVIYTNQPQLLYGDYFISPSQAADFMGTGISYGSDEFKTWEEVITFFSRLGGQ